MANIGTFFETSKEKVVFFAIKPLFFALFVLFFEAAHDILHPEILLIAGDLQGYACYPGTKPSPEWIARQVKFMNEKFLPWCAQYPDVQFVVVAGNNDEFALDPANPLKMLPSGSNVHYLQDGLVEFLAEPLDGLADEFGSPFARAHRPGSDDPGEQGCGHLVGVEADVVVLLEE